LSFPDFVIDQLNELGGVTLKAMFGGHGIYKDGKFFGIIHKERLYFKTNEATNKKYQDAGMIFFTPNKKQKLKNYYEVPPDVLEDSDILKEWALESVNL